jgi:hypothetical protein
VPVNKIYQAFCSGTKDAGGNVQHQIAKVRGALGDTKAKLAEFAVTYFRLLSSRSKAFTFLCVDVRDNTRLDADSCKAGAATEEEISIDTLESGYDWRPSKCNLRLLACAGVCLAATLVFGF